MMNIQRFSALLLLLALLQGCTSEAWRKSARPALPHGAQVQNVYVTLTPEVQGALWYNEDIKPRRVLGAMKRNLKERGMLAKPSERHLPTIEIVITDVRARSAGAAQWFGFLAGEDRIVGDVVVRDANGQEIERVKVKTTYAWGGPAGTNQARMSWLYDRFAERAAEQLTGQSLPHETLERISSSKI